MASRLTKRSEPAVVVTADSHVGPPYDQLRPYCEERYLEDFDQFAKHITSLHQVERERLLENFGGDEEAFEDSVEGWISRNAQGTGIYDMAVRMSDMDADGVAGEVIFHGTPNSDGQILPVPFQQTILNPSFEASWTARDRDLAAAGRQAYNRWLADFCTVQPERHVGLCQVPIWDIDRSVEVVRWAADHGLRGVNFPPPQQHLPSYEDPVWDPFFATCAELGMPLTTHVGGTYFGPSRRGPGAFATHQIEFPSISGRNIWHMIFLGVFDRHPSLSLVVTEVPGTWFQSIINDMESIYHERYRGGALLRPFLNGRPLDYVKKNIFLGFSFMSRTEARTAVELDLDDRVMWGSDYPHPEGTWVYYPASETPQTSVTRLSLANTFAGLTEPQVRRMAGENAMNCYGMDARALREIADSIGPTIEELTTAPDLSEVPDDYVGLGFRTDYAWT